MAKKTNTQAANEVTAEELEQAIDTEAVEEIMDEEEYFDFEPKSKSAGLLMKAAEYLESRAVKKAAKKAEQAEKGGSKLMTGLKIAGGAALAVAAGAGAMYLFGKDSDDTTAGYIEADDDEVVADATYEEVSETSVEE